MAQKALCESLLLVCQQIVIHFMLKKLASTQGYNMLNNC